MERNTSLFHRTCWLTVLVFFAALLGGCGPAELPVIKVTGKVLFEGIPVEGAMVTFVPNELNGRGASGMTDKNGEFLILTQGATKSGCLPGSYRVIVSKHIDVDERGNPVKPSNKPPPSFADPSAPPQKRPVSKSVLPDKYGKVETSGLTADVTKQEQNAFVFELTK